jgi:hypothetical protein
MCYPQRIGISQGDNFNGEDPMGIMPRKSRDYILYSASILLLTSAAWILPPVIAQAQAVTESPERAARMRWFREAKFGLFIHWGLYAIPAGEWKGQPIAGIGEWILNRAKIPVEEYEQLASRFNPTQFNAEEWVQLAVDTGMKYLVITSKHHDGFAMYASQASPYNIVDATPLRC